MKSTLSRISKTFALAFALAATFATAGRAQILGSIYDEAGGQSPAAATDFSDAGVTGISSSAAVDGFAFAQSQVTAATSNGLTVTPVGSFGYPTGSGTAGTGVYQYSVTSSPEAALTVSGLSAQLSPGSTYTLYVFGRTLFDEGATTIGYTYGSESNTASFSADPSQQDNVAIFTITTGTSSTDSLTLTDTEDETDPSFIGVTGFAITGSGVIPPATPEPNTYALMGIGLSLLLVTMRNRRLFRI